MKNILFVLILAFTLPFIGCRSGEKENLIGSWRQIPYVNPEEAANLNVWTFTGGDALNIVFTEQESGIIDSTTYTYSIDGDKLRVFLMNEDDRFDMYAGEYWVDVLDDDYLKMTRKKSSEGEATWIRYEFAKE